MASVSEKLIYTLRTQISHKLNKLPLRFFDGNKPSEILSRVTNDLDKVSETLQTGLKNGILYPLKTKVININHFLASAKKQYDIQKLDCT